MSRRLLIGIALAGMVGCAAKASIKAEAKEPELTDPSPSTPVASRPGDPATTSAITAAPATTSLPAGCSLVCNLADAKGRMAPDMEQKFTTALANDIETLRGCSWRSSLTLRFDSAGTLTEYGVDGEENACVTSVRGHHPELSYPGPAIVRCAERCANGSSPRRR